MTRWPLTMLADWAGRLKLATAMVLLAAVVWFLSVSGFRSLLWWLLVPGPPPPSKEEHIRDCPRLQNMLYQRYRETTDPDLTIPIVIRLNGPDGDLEDRFGLVIRNRLDGVLAGRARVAILCDLANASQVRDVFYDSPPHFP